MTTSITLDDSHVTQSLAEKAQEKADEAVGHLQRIEAGYELCGWYDWPRQQGMGLLEQIREWKSSLTVHYDTVVVCGIGGSFAGARAVDQALRTSFPLMTGLRELVFAGHHLSETYLIELLEYLDQKKPLVVAISKSGTTTEPAIGLRVLRRYLDQRFGNESSRRLVAITDQHDGALRTLATEKGLQTFVVPDNIGGRFSVMTAVGLVPLELVGHNCRDLLLGASQVYQSLADVGEDSHPAIRLACLRDAAWHSGYRVDALAYSEPKLAGFVEWWKQLYGESEGKQGLGLFPTGLAYSTDLHSLGQYMQEGWASVLETFLVVDSVLARARGQVEHRLRIPTDQNLDELSYLEERFVADVDRAAVESALKAHSQRGLPCIKLHVNRLDTYSLGQLLAFFQTSCALSGMLLGVNPFDQPGVEAYKRHLFRAMNKPGYT